MGGDDLTVGEKGAILRAIKGTSAAYVATSPCGRTRGGLPFRLKHVAASVPTISGCRTISHKIRHQQ